MAEAALTPDEIRSLLRECITVVAPGETLIIRVPLDWDSKAVWEYQERLGAALEFYGSPFRALVLPAESFGVAQAANG